MTQAGVCDRNGTGVQEWTDGSRYQGEFRNGLKHGDGTFTWPNGEYYKGYFYKDYRHGRGNYFWPDGSQFMGKFYLNRKEGYGVHLFPDGTIFKGLYHANERLGPGVMTYPDDHQDVGMWYRQWLLRFCTSVKGAFTLKDFPEHMSRLPQQFRKQIQSPPSLIMGSCIKRFLTSDTYLGDASCVENEKFILPPGIERYSTDSDHLPVPQGFRQELNLHFFERDNISKPLFSNEVPLVQRMEAHIQTHRSSAAIGELDWNVAAVLSMTRDHFASKGPLELRSESLIKEASLGNLQNVQNTLRDQKVHPDVGDIRGHTALIAATVNCHDNVINLLLDSGADVNKLNFEGMSALAVCSVLYYPLQSLQETVAEKTSQDITPELKISEPSPLANSTLETAAKKRLNDEVNTELLCTESQVIDEVSKDEQVPQQTQHGQIRVVEGKLYKNETNPLEENIPEDPSDWNQVKDEGANKNEITFRNKSPEKEHGSNAASPMDSFHIHSTEVTLEQMANVLYETCLVSPTETQDTVNRVAVIKIKKEAYWVTMKLLLERGADPNVSRIPMPVMFLAIKAGHVEAVQRLLEAGARTDMHLPAEQKGLYPLHIAAGLTGPEGPKITELLLKAAADPDVKAQDANEVYKLDKNAKDIVALLLSHKANTNHLWSGHSPLSLAIASGNDLAVDELLAAGADPNLPLTGRVGNALCAAVNIHYNAGPSMRSRIKLDWRVAHIPYHALKQQEREAYNARGQLITMMAELMRQAATSREKQRIENEKSQGIYSEKLYRLHPTPKNGALNI
ncbi:Ankyrin repeat and MYND domain-containing protein 1 [Bagarius yarrelli]|uniref:Ankyrin repeat and MYND domain-containing protein 1 n=1 Tax=Bagarius yarrelli TaxID=175774 RepID=A0A556TS81_BAGYA|nr:Ankyrin repeat and MYND domain-containing protein 1 [Bagarius yarrelli]